MLTIFWNPEGFPLIDVLPEGTKFTAGYFIDKILSRILELYSPLIENNHRKITLHFDNARPHTARKVNDFMAVHHMKRAPHPAYSPDLAPSDFYLFGFLKKNWLVIHSIQISHFLNEYMKFWEKYHLKY